MRRLKQYNTRRLLARAEAPSMHFARTLALEDGVLLLLNDEDDVARNRVGLVGAVSVNARRHNRVRDT